MTVYVVTSGEYSDYGIEGVFSSTEAAERYMGGKPEIFNPVAEWEMDGEQPVVWGTRHRVELLWDGTVKPTCHGDRCWSRESRVPEEHKTGERGASDLSIFASKDDDTRARYKHYPWFSAESYVSAEHAMKLVAELRQKTLREHPEWFS